MIQRTILSNIHRRSYDACKKQPLPRTNFFSTVSSYSVSKRFPTHLIFGANTDVGKTVVSTSLVKYNVDHNQTVNYIKPLQCGGSDEAFVKKHLNGKLEILENGSGLHTLFEWDTPASPHLASRLENKPMSDEMVLSTLQSKMSEITSGNESKVWIETAGGVLSPSAASPDNRCPRHANEGPNSWGWSTQADLYKPLHLPAILVGDGRLGGISATLSALESLILRGYDVHGIVLIDESEGEHGSNLPALKEYANRCMSLKGGGGRSLLRDEDSIVSLPPLPPLEVPLDGWLESSQVKEQVERLDGYLNGSWDNHVEILQGLKQKGTDSLWWPFTQHQGHDSATIIDGAAGDNYSVLTQEKDGMTRTANFDACSSWWTQGMGHGESSLSLAAAAAAGKFGHVIFADTIHEPAVTLTNKLLHSKSGPGRDWASRVFFTDDGSTAMEVAIKMGMKKYVQNYESSGGSDSDSLQLTVCAQKDCYHGDTLGVMDVAEPSVFNEGQHPWYESKGLFLSYPTISYVNGSIGVSAPSDCPADDSNISFENLDDVLNVDERLSSNLYKHYCETIQKQWDSYQKETNQVIGSVIIEPVLLGAGGMRFIDPLWQRALMDISRSQPTPVPIIFDEVAAGLYRIGVASCREIIKADPDIAAYAKLLTGGLVPMSVTLASEDVFDAFLGDTKGEALLHGHSYTAHPVGCVSGIHALDTYSELFENDDVDYKKAYFDPKVVAELSKLPLIKESMSLGTVMAVTLEPVGSGTGYAAAGRSKPVVKHLLENGVFCRPLGNVVYIMVSPLTSSEECTRLCNLLTDAILSLDEQ